MGKDSMYKDFNNNVKHTGEVLAGDYSERGKSTQLQPEHKTSSAQLQPENKNRHTCGRVASHRTRSCLDPGCERFVYTSPRSILALRKIKKTTKVY